MGGGRVGCDPVSQRGTASEPPTKRNPIADGNVGELLKSLSGITTDTDVNEVGTVTTVSIRGFSSAITRVSSDGAKLANTGIDAVPTVAP
jgi:hypothetical protein